MSNKRITDLTELTTPTTDDVFPVVDIATNTTTKVQLGNLPTTTAVTTALATKQDTLVSGTNIKTLNSTSLLGSGNIVLTANPSGVAGAIQFSNGSAFASDAANLFWDDTNNRLGIGTNVPTQALDVVGQGRFSDNILFSTDFKHIGRDLNNSSISFSSINSRILAKISTGGSFEVYNSASGTSRFAVSNSGQTTISGGGSTSATTSLLVQNSAGATAFLVRDDNVIEFNNNTLFNVGSIRAGSTVTGFINSAANAFTVMRTNNSNGNATFDQFVAIGTTSSPVASAALEVVSTTRGFLPPRMTTTQKNAITAVAGLVLYDSTTNKLQCYNGSTWNDLF